MASKRNRSLVAVGLVLVALAAGWAWRKRSHAPADASAKGGDARAADRRTVAVLTGPVERRDVPIYVDGLGTVIAYRTVTVRTQVEGRLDRVAFREGQAVKRGTLLAQVDPRPFTIQLHQAQAAQARDTAQLQAARANLERYATVAKDKLIAQQQVDDQRALVAQVEATIASDRAQVEQARLMLNYARIVSPIDGVTGVRLVDQGNVVRPTDATGLVVVTQLDPIAVLFTLPQDDLPRVSRAMRQGKLTVEARSRDGADVLGTGELELVDNQINPGTATIRLKAILPNPERALWPNQFVKARLRLEIRKAALVVPAAAVQRGPGGTFVYVVGKDGTAASRPVQIDSIEGELAVIKQADDKGLVAGEQVVTDGQNQLRPGSKVEVRRPVVGGPRP